MRTTQQPLSRLLWRIGACQETRDWAKQYGTDYKKAWTRCKNGEWLLWILARVAATERDRRALKLSAIGCVRLLGSKLHRFLRSSVAEEALDAAEDFVRLGIGTRTSVRERARAAHRSGSSLSGVKAAVAEAAACAAFLVAEQGKPERLVVDLIRGVAYANGGDHATTYAACARVVRGYCRTLPSPKTALKGGV